MKKAFIIGFLITIILSFGIAAQAENWNEDFEKASSEAKTSGKYLLLDFSGSDWCSWCMKLEKEVLSHEAFKTFAKENLVCVLIDFPSKKYQSKKRKEENGKLMEKFKVRGFPTIIILSPDGELLGTTGYRRGGAEKYVAHLKETINKHKMK
ncbi:MAG: thioredoxin family protein [Syntrophales bacterium]|nr:thioredoxin family protein [Syntrophales bacterium]